MFQHLSVIQQIKQLLEQATGILVITHQHPDGDGLGAMSALAQYLKKSDKNYTLFCRDKVPANFVFLPLMHEVTTDQLVFKREFDAVVILDSGDLVYAGIDQLLNRGKIKKLINFQCLMFF